MNYIRVLLLFSMPSLFSASLVRLEQAAEVVIEDIAIFNENVFLLSDNPVTHTLKVNYQLVQPKLNLVAGHTGLLVGGDTQERGETLHYPQGYGSGFKVEYVNSNNDTSNRYRIIVDYFARPTLTNFYEKADDSDIFFNGINAADFASTPFVSGQTKFGYEQFICDIESGTFGLQVFNTSYSLSSGVETIVTNLGHSKTGQDATGTTHGYSGKQYSIGLGSVTKIEIKRRLHAIKDATFDVHATVGFGSAYTWFQGVFQTIELPVGGTNSEDHRTELPENLFITSISSDYALVYQTIPTKEKPTSTLFAIGGGSRTLNNIDQIEAVSFGSPGTISQSFLYIRIGYSL